MVEGRNDYNPEGVPTRSEIDDDYGRWVEARVVEQITRHEAETPREVDMATVTRLLKDGSASSGVGSNHFR